MEGMFHDCTSLNYLNIDNFNTSSIINMKNAFYNCKSLTSLDVSSFDTSLVENMQGMFGQCQNLISLSLNNFKTSKVTNMEMMFCGSFSLLSLDLKNFDISSVNNMEYMFFGLESIIFLNLGKFQESSNKTNTLYMFMNINSNLLLCINSEKNSKIYSEIPTNIISNNNNCENICFSETVKINAIDKNCINDCKSTKYPFEYNKICYEKCPENTYLLSDNEFLCVKYCEKYDKFYNYNKTSCIDEIPEGFFLNDTIKNTIDKCHPYCKTCHKKNNDSNTNCDLCQNDKYYHWGNCSSNCIYGYYEDESGKKICNCIYNIKCKECSTESLELGLCISCNNGYYQKIDDISSENSFIDCYKDPEGYYLDDNIYKPCYPSCKHCSGFGDKSNHKCIECNSNYKNKDSQNCYN
jgi:surface protein